MDPVDPSSTARLGPSSIADVEWMRVVAMIVATMEVHSVVPPLTQLDLSSSSWEGT